ncbi:group 1 truncated hemoglobin [Streptomyces sp. NPDC051940]|uniref:group I truncated hemoglobin n=1 Tax=Streptomyces sp. NPDC051940 TaxID=3155675 RepID=UPI003422B6FE
MSIYDSIGGEAAVSAAVDDFYKRVLADPSLTGYFEDIDVARLKGHQRAFIGAALGGPARYNGRPMAKAHEGLGITPDDFGRVVGHLVDTLDSLGVPSETIGRIGDTLAPLQQDIAPGRA